MKKGILSLAALVLIAAGQLKAQKDSTVRKEIRIEKRLNREKPEKTVIIIDGEKMTVNGKEVEGLKDLQGKLQGLEGLDGKFDFDMEALRPQMQDMMRNFGPQLQKNFRNFHFDAPGNQAMLGVNVQKDEKGARVTEVVKESAADKAGLKADDIITAINADKIADGDALVQTIGKYKPEDVVDVTVLRSGKEKKFKAALGKNEATTITGDFDWNGNSPDLRGAGPRVFNFNRDEFGNFNTLPADRPKFGFDIKDNEDGDGVVITEVKDGTNASKAGLKENDIITEAAGAPIKNVDELKRVLAENRDKPEIAVKVLRSGKAQTLTLRVPKKIKTAEL